MIVCCAALVGRKTPAKVRIFSELRAAAAEIKRRGACGKAQ